MTQLDDTQNLEDIEQHVARRYDLQAGPLNCTLIRAYDLSTCLAGLSDEARNSVLSAYDKVRPLLAAERESIPAFQQIRPIWDVGDVLGMRAAWNNHAKFGADFADELERRLQAL